MTVSPSRALQIEQSITALEKQRHELQSAQIEMRSGTQSRSMTSPQVRKAQERDDELKRVEQALANLRAELAGDTTTADELRAVAHSTEGSTRTRSQAPAAGSVSSKQRGVYGPDSERSYFLDTVKAEGGDMAARTAREDHIRHVMDMEKRDLANVSNKGAEAIVPLFLQEKFEQARVAKAVAANLANQNAMPEKGDTITIPVQTGNASVAALTQADPLNTMSETNAAFDTKTANIAEVGGTQDLSNYLVDRGTLGVAGVDMVIGAHLADLLAKDEDERVLSGMITNAGVAATYTATTGTLAEIYKKLAQVAAGIHAGNLEAPTAILVHPRRFMAWCSELDQNNRPLVLPNAHGAQNALVGGSDTGVPVAQGFTGFSVLGIPIYTDANIGITSGAGTNQDTVLIADMSAVHVWRGGVMIDVDRSTLFTKSGLSVRARRYFATMSDHRVNGIGKIEGTGLATPTW